MKKIYTNMLNKLEDNINKLRNLIYNELDDEILMEAYISSNPEEDGFLDLAIKFDFKVKHIKALKGLKNNANRKN